METSPVIKGSSDIIRTTMVLYKTKEDFLNRYQATHPNVDRQKQSVSNFGLALSKKKDLIYIKAITEDIRIFTTGLLIPHGGSILMPEGIMKSGGTTFVYDSQNSKFTNYDKHGIWIVSCSEDPIELTIPSKYPCVPYATYNNYILAIILTEKMKKVIGEYEVAHILLG